MTLEKREYSRDQLTLDQQALRIVDGRYKGERPAEKEVESLAGPEEIKNRVRALFDERERQKPKLMKPVETQLSMAPQRRTGESHLDAQAKSYLEQLITSEIHGYNPAHLALTNGGLYMPEESGILQAPTIEQVMETLEQLTPEEVERLKKLLLEAELSIEPIGLGWRKYIDSLDTGARLKYGTNLSSDTQKEFDRQDEVLGIKGPGEIIGWDICIGEGSKEDLESHSGFFKDIIGKWKGSEAYADGFNLPTHQSYALDQKRKLVLASSDPYQIQGKEAMDTDGVSLLQRADNGEVICPDKSATVGSDNWRTLGLHRVGFSGYDTKSHYSGVRFRPRLVLRAILRKPLSIGGHSC
ncbi:MAG: hypothetical protein WC604_04170 [Candidatus Gracilibacteria bacterium]